MIGTLWSDTSGGYRFRDIGRLCVAFLVAIVLLGVGPMAGGAQALDAFPVTGAQDRVELTQKGVAVGGRGDRLQIDTAPGADGISRRMSVNATTAGTNPNWIVFALTNRTDKVLVRWITIQRYSLIGSGVIWPDLDSRRMAALTPSVGFLPQRIKNDRADIFKIEIEPGQTVTYAAEMASARLSRIYMWKPLAYELHVRERRLFNGIMLGITGLLGIFLTAVFAANHKAIFPSAALVTWCVLIYLCVDFGFWHKLLQISSEDNAVYRAASEAAMATSIALFLHTFLRLGSWHGFARMLSSVWIVAQLALVFIAVLDPRLASTFARLSFAALGGIGALMILFLAARGQDRALSIIPTWLLFVVWLFGAAMTLTGKLNGDIVVSSLVAGLVLITVLIGFTVTQFAFRSIEPHYGAAPSEQQLRSLAVEGAGAAVWEWHARRGEIKVGAIAEVALGLNLGELSTKVKDFVRYMHPADQERFNVLLWTIQNKSGGDIRTDFRMRHADNSYRWFDLEAASVPTSDRRSLRCVGLLRDVTDQKRSQARLMQDAVVDNLTGLPNRELLLDRLKTAVARVADEPELRPTVLYIDLDKFKGVNSSFGLIVGDSLLLTISRRLARHLQPMDTLARLGDDRFAMLVLSVSDPEELARLAESARRALRAPIKIAGQDIVLTGTIGIAVHDSANSDELDILKNAEIAMYRAKRNGADQIEIFRPDMRDERDDRAALEDDLRRALERRQVKVFYQPIIYLPTEELAGFEAQVRWEHSDHGLLNPQDYVSFAEDSDLIVKLGSYVLSEAVAKAVEWQKRLPRAKHPLFVSVNVANRQLFRQDLIQEIRHILSQEAVPDKVLRLEITESLVMENPERAAEILDLLEVTGAGLALDDFGTGYSSLAYLERFPFDTIKLDRHLVQASGDGQGGGSSIVRSIVAMAKELNKKVVAEGVETSQDVGFLRSIGCQYAQGYYYGEPMGERDVVDLLKIVRKSERKHQRRGIFGGGLGRKDEDGTEPEQPPAATNVETVVEKPASSPTASRPQANENPERSDGLGRPSYPAAASGNRGAPPQPGTPQVRNDASQPPPMRHPTTPPVMPPTSTGADAKDTPPTMPRRMPPPHWRHAPQVGTPSGDMPPANDQIWDQGRPQGTHQRAERVVEPSVTSSKSGSSDRDGRPTVAPVETPPQPPEFLQRPPQVPTANVPPAQHPRPPVLMPSPPESTNTTSGADVENEADLERNALEVPGWQPHRPGSEGADQRPPVSSIQPTGNDHDASSAGPANATLREENEAAKQPAEIAPPSLETPPRIDETAEQSQRLSEDPAQPEQTKPARDFSTLPPGIAQSLARLAGVPAPVTPANDKDPVDDDEGQNNNSPPPRKVEAGE